jgi:hypothetical protein
MTFNELDEFLQILEDSLLEHLIESNGRNGETMTGVRLFSITLLVIGVVMVVLHRFGWRVTRKRDVSRDRIAVAQVLRNLDALNAVLEVVWGDTEPSKKTLRFYFNCGCDWEGVDLDDDQTLAYVQKVIAGLMNLLRAWRVNEGLANRMVYKYVQEYLQELVFLRGHLLSHNGI